MASVSASQGRALGSGAEVRDHLVVAVKVSDIAESADVSHSPSSVDWMLHMRDSHIPCIRASYTMLEVPPGSRGKALTAE